MKRGVQMKKLLLGSVALIVMSAPVLAADMPVKVKPLPPVWTWTGCYVGLNVGYTAARFEKSNVRQVTQAGAVVTTFADFDFDDDGVSGGVQLGCNWQSGVIVWGVETDIQVTSVEGQASIRQRDLQRSERWLRYRSNLGAEVVRNGSRTPWLDRHADDPALRHRRLRLWPRQVELVLPDHLGAPTTFFASDSNTHFGWTVGFGAEAKITQNFSAKLEYLYVDLGSKEYFLDPLRRQRPWDQRLDFHTVRLGLNYQFNWYEHGGREILIDRSAARKAPGKTRGFFVPRKNKQPPRTMVAPRRGEPSELARVSMDSSAGHPLAASGRRAGHHLVRNVRTAANPEFSVPDC